MHGVLIVDKPNGPTSHDVVHRARKLLKSKQIGHAGTLDPMATGVLVLAIGEATKLVPWLTAADKAYETTIQLGIGTDTLDAQGKEVARLPVNLENLEAALQAERERTMQSPPAYSAIKIDGVRAHELARAGELEGDLPERPIEVRSIELLGQTEDTLTLRMDVAKGYFVRSLARDLAAGLGTVGHLTALRRIKSGSFTIDEAKPLGEGTLISVTDAAKRALPISVLTEQGVKAAKHGQRLSLTWLNEAHPSASVWLDEAGALIAIGDCSAGYGQVLRGFTAVQ